MPACRPLSIPRQTCTHSCRPVSMPCWQVFWLYRSSFGYTSSRHEAGRTLAWTQRTCATKTSVVSVPNGDELIRTIEATLFTSHCQGFDKFLTCFTHLLLLTDFCQSRREHSVNLASARTAMKVSKSLGTRPAGRVHQHWVTKTVT